MLIGIAGTQGSGKSLIMSIIATFLRIETGAELFDNYSLIDSRKIKTIRDLWSLNSAVVCLDELWLTMDSRLWKDNVMLTRWINQCRKKDLLVFYTTQHMSQIEMRVRNATDYVIYCEERNKKMWIKFVDWQYGILHKQFLIENPEDFYPLFDTYQVLQPIEM